MTDFRVQGIASMDPGQLVSDIDLIIDKLDEATDAAARFGAEIDSIGDKKIKIDIEIPDEQKLIDLKALIDSIDSGPHTLTIHIDIQDFDEAVTKLEEIDHLADDKLIEIAVEVTGADEAVAKLEAVDKAENNLSKDVSKASDSNSGFSFSLMSLLPLFTAIIPILAVVGAGIIAAAGSFAILAVGLGGFALAAKSAFTSITAMQQALSANTIAALANANSSQQVYNILQKNSALFDKMNPQVKTLAVQYELLKNSYSNFQKSVDPKVIPALTTGMTLVTQLMQGLPGLVNPAAQAVNTFLTGFIQRLKDPTFQTFYNNMKTNMGTFVSQFLNGIGNVIQGIVALFNAFMPVSVQIGTGWVRMTLAFERWSESLSQSNGFKSFIAYVQKEGPVVLNTFGQLIILAGHLGSALSGMGGGSLGGIDKLLQSINKFASANPEVFKLVTSFAILGMTIGKLAPLVGPVIDAVGAIGALATPIGLVVVVIAALAAAIVGAYLASTTFRNYVNSELGKLWSSMKGDITQAEQWFSGFWVGIKQIWAKDKGDIESIVNDLFGWIAQTFQSAIQIIEGILDIFEGIFEGNWSKIGDGIRKIWDGLWSFVGATIDDAVNLVLSLLSMLWNGIHGLWDSGVRDVENALGILWNYVETGWLNMALSVVHTVEGWWVNVGVAVTKGWNDVASFFDQIPGWIGGFFSSAGDILYNVGKNIVQGLLNGLESMWNSVKNWFGNLTNSITSWKGPPEKDAVLLTPAGASIMDGFINGLNSRKNAVQSTLDDFTKTVSNTFGSNYVTKVSADINAGLSGMNGGSTGSSGGVRNMGNSIMFGQNSININTNDANGTATAITRVMQTAATFGMAEAPDGSGLTASTNGSVFNP